MTQTADRHATLDDWINSDALRFSLDSVDELNAAVDRVVAHLGDEVEMLGFGEPMHGAEEFLILRNRLFQRLVESHGYTAIAMESSFPKGFRVNDFVLGHIPGTYDEIRETGFGHNAGNLEANRELIEWMRHYNEGEPKTQLRFYGFDMPTATTGIAGPRAVVPPALKFLIDVDAVGTRCLRKRVESHFGDEAAWENPAAYFDPSKSIGLTPEAGALRLAIEDLIGEFDVRSPALISAGGDYYRARQHAVVARGLLNYHAAIAGRSGLGTQLGIRDAIMADNLKFIGERERSRGKVFVFAHNSHLQKGRIEAWEAWRKALNAEPFGWWSAGAHLRYALGPKYAAVGTAVGVSEENGIAAPEPESLEARLSAAPTVSDGGLFIPTHHGSGLPFDEIVAAPARSASSTNLSYIPLSPRSFGTFDYLAFLNRATYQRGGPPLPARQADSK
jgi:erythromycin esterase-like protein